MLTHALETVGRAVMSVPEPNIDRNTDALKLGLRRDSELNLAVGSAVLFFAGFLLIFGLGLAAGSIFHNAKLGADAGGCICAVGITGYLLHYARSKVVDRRIERLRRGEAVDDPLKRTFRTSSSDLDFLILGAIGVAISGSLYLA